jgi:hypothetical protein
MIPCSAELLSIELIGEAATSLDPEFLYDAVAAVLHFFKHDQGRVEVSVTEFSQALERVMSGLGVTIRAPGIVVPAAHVGEADLRQLACESGKGFELVFFSRVREELRRKLEESPRLVRFRGLRGCVKQLVGAQRWSGRCQQLSDQIVAYLRGCFDAERRRRECALLVL